MKTARQYLNVCKYIFLCILISLTTDCKNKEENKQARTVDSLLTVLYDIQDTISSHEVQTLYEVSQVISQDLELVYDSMYETVINTPVAGRYSELLAGVESCILACSEYHEEIFLIESELQELNTLIHGSDLPSDSIDNKILYESDLLNDLKTRIDTNFSNIAYFTGLFYQLKPLMDSLILQPGSHN